MAIAIETEIAANVNNDFHIPNVISVPKNMLATLLISTNSERSLFFEHSEPD